MEMKVFGSIFNANELASSRCKLYDGRGLRTTIILLAVPHFILICRQYLK